MIRPRLYGNKLARTTSNLSSGTTATAGITASQNTPSTRIADALMDKSRAPMVRPPGEAITTLGDRGSNLLSSLKRRRIDLGRDGSESDSEDGKKSRELHLMISSEDSGAPYIPNKQVNYYLIYET